MTHEKTLYIAFRDNQVAVHSGIHDVLVWIERCFCEMLEYKPVNIVKNLEVYKKEEKFILRENDDSSVENGSLNTILEFLNKVVIHHLIQAHPNLLWIHAGAVVYRDYAVVFSGAWGKGKSTLVTSLCDHGWTYLSDDIVPLDLSSGKVIPFSQTPTVREDPGREIPLHRLGELRKIEVNLRQKRVGREPVPIGAIVFPTYSRYSSTRIVHCSPSTAVLELLKSCLNFEGHREEAVHHLCRLLSRLPSLRLFFSNGKHAAELIACPTKFNVNLNYVNS
ncbi:MAG: hypothetical protein MRK02_15545 [Candidatus Scalindua sp.]|nr:hypothetical protein [Candidatus Scalindua sp.]